MLDILLILILVIYFLSGLRRGFFISLGALVGFIAGACAAFYVTPWVVTQVSANWHMIAAMASVVLCVIVGQWIGFLLGRAIRKVSDTTGLRGVERLAGGLLSLVVCAAVMLVLILTIRPLGIPQVSTALSKSKVSNFLLDATPDPVEEKISEIRTDLISSATIPEVSELLYPKQEAPTEDFSTPALEQASYSVVQILGVAEQCHYTSEGSGFVVADDYVVTNAHVVAGVTDPVVQDRNGNSTSGEVVYYDAEEDLAIIHATGLGLDPLNIGGDVASGTTVSFMGYPLGGPFKARPGIVQGLGRTQTIDSATGQRNPSRLVYQLAAEVEQGNSGGPVLAEDGTVIGVIFAKATEGQTGYAIPSSVLQEALAGLGSYTEEVSTGVCSAS